jgi:hypothetical protein
MDIQARKTTFIQEFLNIQNEEIIISLEKLLEKELKKVSEDYFYPMTLEEFNTRIDKSLNDSKKGKFTETKKLLKEIQSWD